MATVETDEDEETAARAAAGYCSRRFGSRRRRYAHDVELVVSALEMALARRRPGPGLVHPRVIYERYGRARDESSATSATT